MVDTYVMLAKLAKLYANCVRPKILAMPTGSCSYPVYTVCIASQSISLINVVLAGDQELQLQASHLLTDRAELNCPDSVLHALRNMPSSALLAWTICPQLTAAVLPADSPGPETQNSLADAYELCR